MESEYCLLLTPEKCWKTLKISQFPRIQSANYLSVIGFLLKDGNEPPVQAPSLLCRVLCFANVMVISRALWQMNKRSS